MSRPILGILGAGRAGTAIARQSMKAGYSVLIANSRGPASLRLMVEVLIPGATAVTAEEAVSRSDIVYLALPLGKYRGIPAEKAAGKIVIDAMNYWPAVDGFIEEFQQDSRSSSELIQDFLPRSQVVKTLNHIGYHELEEEGLPPGTKGRRAVVLAGNNPEAKVVVARLISDLGFDFIDAGPLSEGWRFGPGTPVFGGRYTARDLREALESASREQDTRGWARSDIETSPSDRYSGSSSAPMQMSALGKPVSGAAGRRGDVGEALGTGGQD